MSRLEESLFCDCKFYYEKYIVLKKRLSDEHSVTQVVRGKYFAILHVIEQNYLFEEYVNWLEEKEGENHG